MSQVPHSVREKPSATRQRAKHCRSRLGCGVCRVRRVRCDQTRPACNRCTSTGRKCDGYIQAAQTFPQPVPITPRRSPQATLVELKESYALRHFALSTSRELAGDFADDFWRSLVLQASVKEPCIRHLTVAMASLHGYLQPQVDMVPLTDEFRSLALSHYLKGIHRLNNLIARSGWAQLDTILMCSVLCIFFEWKQNNHASALVHLQSSLQMLQQWLSPHKADLRSSLSHPKSCIKRTSPEGRFIRLTLMPVLAKILLQAVSLVDAETLAASLPDINLASELTPVREFNDLTEAKSSVFSFLVQVYLQPPNSTQASHSFFAIQQVQWSERLEVLLQQPSARDSSSLAQVINLKIWREITFLMVVRKSAESDAVFDQFTDRFRRAFELCAELVELQQSHFTADISIVLVLYFIAFHAPDFALRRRAISLLEKSRRHEGIWDSNVAAKLAKRALEADEQGLRVDQETTHSYWVLHFKTGAAESRVSV